MSEIIKASTDVMKEAAKEVLEGNVNPLEFMIKVAAMEKALKDAKDQVKEYALEEFEKHNQKEVEMDGVKISKTSGGRYSYKHIEEWVNLNNLKKEIEKKSQEAYKAQMHGASVVTDDGEVYEAAEFVPNKESISIKF